MLQARHACDRKKEFIIKKSLRNVGEVVRGNTKRSGAIPQRKKAA